MIKYVVTNSSGTVEFSLEQSANDYAGVFGGNVSQITEADPVTPTQEEIEIALAKKKREFGQYLSGEFTDMIAAKNKMQNLSGAQIISVLTALGGLAALLERGGLGTVRVQLQSLIAANSMPLYNDVFQHGIDDINQFEAEFGL